jgi:two-component system sensor kinase FixL
METTMRSGEFGNGIAHVMPAWHAATTGALFLSLYWLLDWVTYVYPARFGITPFNPDAAVAIVLLLLYGLKYTPLVFLAVFVDEYIIPSDSRTLVVALLNTLVLTASYVAVAHLLSARFRIRADLATRRDVLRLIGVTLVCLLLCGIAYVNILVQNSIGPADRFYNGVRRFWTGYSVGILIGAPLLLMCFSERRRRQFRQLLESPYAYMQMAAIVASIWFMFREAPLEHFRYFYVLFIPMVWAATQFGLVGAVFSLVLIQTGVLLEVHAADYQPVFQLQLVLTSLVITGLLLGVSVDERERATRDFRESLRLAAAGEMAAAITHELNQPLTAMSSYATAGQLIAAAPEPDRVQLNDTMSKLVAESKRTAAVVRRLRDFFRSGATRLDRVSIADVAKNAVESLRARATAAGVELRCNAVSNLPSVLLDTVQIDVVLRNLLINAIESAAAADHGSVLVDVQLVSADRIQVAVKDNGAGIRAEDAERLFESFVTTKAAGMGIGLAISRAIVEAHGGEMRVTPGDSGLVYFTLPCDKEAM